MVDVDALVLWLFGGVQVAGLISAWLTRLSEGSHREGLCQWLFLICLAMVGSVTFAAVAMQSRTWILCGGTLSAMVLGAVSDFSSSGHTEPVHMAS